MVALPGYRLLGVTISSAAFVLALLMPAVVTAQSVRPRTARQQTSREQPAPQPSRAQPAAPAEPYYTELGQTPLEASPPVSEIPSEEPATEAVTITDQQPRVPGVPSRAIGNKLDGVWLVDSLELGGESRLHEAWYSTFTIRGDEFSISRFINGRDDYEGRFKLIHGKVPASGEIDLLVPQFEVSNWSTRPVFAAGTLRGLYKISPEAITLCVALGPHQPRPTAFVSSDRAFLITLKRAARGFKDFPKQVAVTVVDPAGQPVAGARVFRLLQIMGYADLGDQQLEWDYHDHGKTGADGVLQIPYDDLQYFPLSAHVSERKLIGTQLVSPAALQRSVVRIVLEPEHRIRGTIVCAALDALGKEIGQTSTGLIRSGRSFASIHDWPGKFEFFAPAGEYMLSVHGDNVWSKQLLLRVPAGKADVNVPPIEVKARNHALLVGGPAPEFVGVLGWHGTPVKLAELRGKVVLLHFWNLDDAIVEMPRILDLYREFHSQGLEVLGVHVDRDGTLLTRAQVEKGMADWEWDWKRKDLPFPVALTSKYRSKSRAGENVPGSVTDQYGVSGCPQTRLIDAQGNLLGDLATNREAECRARLKALLEKRN